MISALQPGDNAKLKVFRNQSEAEIAVTVGKRPRPVERKEEQRE
jgi:S1-C subfamily serine protease